MTPHATEAMDAARRLALKKRLLRAQSALLRHQLGQQVEATVAPVSAAAERVRSGAGWLRAHPGLLAGVAAAAAVLVWRHPAALRALAASVGGVSGLARRGVWLWQAWQRLQPLLARRADPPSS